MKFLAIEKATAGIDWSIKILQLKEEAKKVYELMLNDIIREIYFDENQRAVIILEAKSRENAIDVLAALPLAKNNLIDFDLRELKLYTGFQRLMREQS